MWIWILGLDFDAISLFIHVFLCWNFRVLGSWIWFWLLRVGVGDFNFWGFGTVGHFRVFLVLDLDSWTLFWWHVGLASL